ncbi:MAG TPA: hypothetical protein PK772_09275, partial [Chitinophagaceae bacterium]|nr:hypothetical protein [Chitinophagaceae bacterium]
KRTIEPHSIKENNFILPHNIFIVFVFEERNIHFFEDTKLCKKEPRKTPLKIFNTNLKGTSI